MHQAQLSTNPVSRQSSQQTQFADSIQLRLDEACSDERCTLEAQIAERFAARYDARLSHFLPLLMSLRQDNELSTVVGLRAAGTGELYLERYLDQPIEQKVSQVSMGPVDRNRIVEIGNLVSTQSGSSYLLFTLLAVTLERAGFNWVVFTATRQIRTMLDSMGFASHIVCEAKENSVNDNNTDWGRYYRTQPQVIAGNLSVASALMMSNPAINEMVDALEPQLDSIAAQLIADA